MGAAGPQKTPTKLLSIRGSWRAKTRAQQEIFPEDASLEAPAWLLEDAKPVWERLAPRLKDLGLLTVADIDVVARYCTHFAHWQKATATIQQRGLTYPVRDKDGKITGFNEYPEVGIAARNADILLRLEREFGLTPASRASLGAIVVSGKGEKAVTVSTRGRKPKPKAALSVG